MDKRLYYTEIYFVIVLKYIKNKLTFCCRCNYYDIDLSNSE